VGRVRVEHFLPTLPTVSAFGVNGRNERIRTSDP
jgi:hypothetical protein